MPTPTRNPRIRIENHGPGNWRTEVMDDAEFTVSWHIVGPPYATKLEALSMVGDVESVYLGEGNLRHAPTLYQHLSAPQTANGNPRRVYVIYDAKGDVLDAIDEGYANAPAWVKQLGQLPGFKITAGEYREILKNWAAK
jgi:hypothetical protein